MLYAASHDSHARSPLTYLGPSFTALIHENAAHISKLQMLLSAIPRHNPDRPICAYFLASLLLKRYKLFNQKDDIDKAILYLTDLLLSLPLSRLARGPTTIVALLILAHSLVMRSEVSKGSEDVIYAAKYFRYLRDSVYTPFADQHQQVTASLVETLAFQLEFKASDVVRTLEEMTVLTQELLTSDPSSDRTTRASACFARAAGKQLPELSPHLLKEIIECLRLAKMQNSELREAHFCISRCLYTRYSYNLNDKLDEVMSILDEIIASSSPGDEFLAECQKLVGFLAMLRSAPSHPEHSEEAIYRARAFLSSSSVEDPLYPAIDGLEASSSSDPLPAALDITWRTRPLQKLLDGICNFSIIDIEGAIELGRSLSFD